MSGLKRRILLRSHAENAARSGVHEARSEDDPLTCFLRRHPFSSHALLEGVFGEKGITTLLEKESRQLRHVSIPGMGRCYALMKEPDASLLGTHRREKARRFVLASMGPEVVISGISPGLEADGEFYWGNEHGASWWRIWVDVGGCAPEALSFVADPPEAYGGQVRDIVLAPDIERLEVLAVRIAERWAGRQEVRLWCPEAKTIRTVLPGRRGAGKRWAPHRSADVDALVRQRLRGSHHRSLLGKIGGRLSPDDWAMLVEIGNNPFFTAYELAYLWGDTRKGVQGRRKRVDGLESLGLIETARNAGPRYLTEGRKVLTWRGLELIAGYWGTTVDIMRRFHPWPQRENGIGHGQISYSTKWAAHLWKHEGLTRQFVLALLFGARCVTHSSGGAEVSIDTTIGSRILCRNKAMASEKGMISVAPDARVQVEVWANGWVEGMVTAPRSIERRTVWIEADRSTIPAERLRDRMERYVVACSANTSQRPILVWVIDGSPFREKQILDMMRAQKLDGYTVILERLILPEADRWWLIHPPASLSDRGARVGLPYKSIGGMCPWRSIWLTPGRVGFQPFLGYEPWVGRASQPGDVARRDRIAAANEVGARRAQTQQEASGGRPISLGKW